MRWVLSITRVTCAKPILGRFSVPPKITSSILPPRRALVRCSPITQRIASDILDLPLPFGPTMAVMSFSKVKRVLSGNDLKPWISKARRYIIHLWCLVWIGALAYRLIILHYSDVCNKSLGIFWLMRTQKSKSRRNHCNHSVF